MTSLTIAKLTSLRYIYPKANILFLTIRNGDSIIEELTSLLDNAEGYIKFSYSSSVKHYLIISYDEAISNNIDTLLSANAKVYYSIKKASIRDFHYLNSIAEDCEVFSTVE